MITGFRAVHTDRALVYLPARKIFDALELDLLLFSGYFNERTLPASKVNTLIKQTDWRDYTRNNGTTDKGRQIAFFGQDPKLKYGYGKNDPLPAQQSALVARISALCSTLCQNTWSADHLDARSHRPLFSGVSAMLYGPGTSSGLHVDDEPIIKDSFIASVSWGEEGHFRLQTRQRGMVELRLCSGDLAFFDGSRRHIARVDKGVIGKRLNLTPRVCGFNPTSIRPFWKGQLLPARWGDLALSPRLRPQAPSCSPSPARSLAAKVPLKQKPKGPRFPPRPPSCSPSPARSLAAAVPQRKLIPQKASESKSELPVRTYAEAVRAPRARQTQQSRQRQQRRQERRQARHLERSKQSKPEKGWHTVTNKRIVQKAPLKDKPALRPAPKPKLLPQKETNVRKVLINPERAQRVLRPSSMAPPVAVSAPTAPTTSSRPDMEEIPSHFAFGATRTLIRQRLADLADDWKTYIASISGPPRPRGWYDFLQKHQKMWDVRDYETFRQAMMRSVRFRVSSDCKHRFPRWMRKFEGECRHRDTPREELRAILGKFLIPDIANIVGDKLSDKFNDYLDRIRRQPAREDFPQSVVYSNHNMMQQWDSQMEALRTEYAKECFSSTLTWKEKLLHRFITQIHVEPPQCTVPDISLAEFVRWWDSYRHGLSTRRKVKTPRWAFYFYKGDGTLKRCSKISGLHPQQWLEAFHHALFVSNTISKKDSKYFTICVEKLKNAHDELMRNRLAGARVVTKQ